jgi:competence ComEA-like helix-hairpin-helix protein
MTSYEAKGVVTAFGIIIGTLLVIWGADYFFSQKQQNLVISSPRMLDSLTIAVDNQAREYNKNRQYGSKYPDSKNKSYKHFNFDPNTATVAQLQELGLPQFIAERIDKYRAKGGKFRKKEDLAKIYGLYPETYERLEPYITLPSAEEASVNTPQVELAAQPVAEKPAAIIPKKAETLARFDLNMADTTQLKLIRGIGSGYARRIIKFRDILGGFASAEQIRETYGLPPETADELMKYGYVSGDVKKLKINQVSLAELKHPYLKFVQARAIIAYREQHGSFKSIEDLKQIKIIDEATIQKIGPYLDF